MTGLPDPPYYNVEWDDALEKVPLATDLIYEGSFRVELWLREKAASVILNRTVIEGFHRTVFGGVFPDLAGRLRGEAPRYIPQNVTFGSYRGVLFERVIAAFDEMLLYTRDFIVTLDRLSTSIKREDFAMELVKVAAYVHCQTVHVHPFRNGNGRVARLCVNYFARRYGYQPMPFDRPSGGYLAATNAWHDGRTTKPFEEFLRSLLERLPEPNEQ